MKGLQTLPEEFTTVRSNKVKSNKVQSNKTKSDKVKYMIDVSESLMVAHFIFW